MPKPFAATGGARIGWVNATWPFAQLSATDGKLTISATLLGTYDFTPDQVTAIERYTLIPLLGWGIRIRHRRSEYPERIIFWCLGSPGNILHGISSAGFLAIGSTENTIRPQGIAIRWPVAIGAVVAWNALLLLDFFWSGAFRPQPGPFTLAALTLVFAFSIGSLTSTELQQLVLKPGRDIGEIRPFLRLLAFVAGNMLLIFSLFMALGGFPSDS